MLGKYRIVTRYNLFEHILVTDTRQLLMKEFRWHGELPNTCLMASWTIQLATGRPAGSDYCGATSHCLEWFSNSNGRVVIQSTRLAVRRQGEREFELTDEEWAEQARQNSEEMTHFMHQLGDTLESHGRDGAEEQEDADEGYEDR